MIEGHNDEQIKNLFTGNTSFFTVPRYQRKYVWEEKNWRQLIEDVEYSLEDENWSHFIGTFVFQKKEISPQNTEYVIIDGQQRIITLQLLFMSLIAVLQTLETNDTDEKEDISRYVDIIKDLVRRKPPKGYNIERVFIEYDDFYKIISDTVISDQSIESIISQNAKSNILRCFQFYYSILQTKTFDELIVFYEKVIITKFVGFNSYTEEYAYSIFETLNARGTQLKQMELVKNYLFHYLVPKNDIDIYKRKWIEVENYLFINNLDCDDFLYHIFKCKYKIHHIRIDDLYDQIKKVLNKDPEKIKDFFTNIVECIPIYISIINCENDNEEIAFLLKYFKIKNNKQFRSALMALFYQYKKEKIGAKAFLELLTELRNFLVIYNLRRITANRIDEDVHDLAFGVFNSSCERDIIYNIYMFFLKDRSFFNYSDLSTVVMGSRYSNHKRYTMATSGMFVYLFEILYKNEYIDYEYLTEYKNWTMEHIVNDKSDNDYVSYMGNLLLLTKKLNNKCKDKTFDDKKKLYLESGFAWVRDYVKNQPKQPTEEEIKTRTNKIGETLAKLMSFDISKMKDYCEETSKAIHFLERLKKDESRYAMYLDDFKYDNYTGIKEKLKNKYKEQELVEMLE